MPVKWVEHQLSLVWTLNQLMLNEKICKLLSEGIADEERLRAWKREAIGWHQVYTIQRERK